MSTAFVGGIVSFWFSISAAILTGVGWSVLHSSDVCEGDLHKYVYVVTVASTISLAIYGTGALLAVLSLLAKPLETAANIYNGIFIILMVFLSGILNLTWFFWGILILTHYDVAACKNTVYYPMTIVLVVISGLSILGNLLSRPRTT